MATNTNVKATGQSGRPYKRQVRNIIIHRPMQREFSFMLIALFMVASAAIAWIIHQTIRDAAFGGGFSSERSIPSRFFLRSAIRLLCA